MTSGSSETGRVRLGLIVNPVAGLGGRVGLKGTDGADVAQRARELGAEPQAMARARTTLERLLAALPPRLSRPALLCGPRDMGATSAVAAGWPCEVVGETADVTSAADTRRCAEAMAHAGVGVILFAGGDGTARDIHAAVRDTVAVLGIPAGVKIQSAVFATSPGAAGEAVAQHLAGTGRTVEREVLDLDEDAYRAGRVQPRLHGILSVPAGRLLQSRKAPTPTSDTAATESIAAEVEAVLEVGRRYVLGPGTTTRAVARRLGLDKTLVGVDGFHVTADGPRLVARDASEHDLRTLVAEGPSSIVLTPIGGQGFLFGRGNQPISPAVIRTVGLEHITVLATPAKLAELGGRPMLVDTGDPVLDAELSSYIQVITGRGERAVVRIEQA